MLSLIDSREGINLSTVDDPLVCRLYGDFVTAHRLGPAGSALFWTDGLGLLTEYSGGALTICGETDTVDELLSFIDFLSPDVLMVSDKLKEKLAFDYSDEGLIMSKKLPGDLRNIEIDRDFSLKAYHELFGRNGLESDYQGFCEGMADCVKTSTGFLCGIYLENKLIAGAAVTGITDNSAVITAIAVDREFRHRHLARQLMSRIEQRLRGRELFVFREKKKNEEFYRNLGFSEIDRWYTAELRR